MMCPFEGPVIIRVAGTSFVFHAHWQTCGPFEELCTENHGAKSIIVLGFFYIASEKKLVMVCFPPPL